MTTHTADRPDVPDADVGRRLARLHAVLRDHESRGHELQASYGMYLNQIDAAIEALAAAKEAVNVTARLHREHHDALIASVITALNGEVG